VHLKLREPEKLAFTNYLLLCEPSAETEELDDILRAVHYFSSRSVDLFRLRRLGSESNQHTFLYDRWQNLWSALRNLHDRHAVDDRYDTIMGFMRKGFPESFKDLVFEQIGADRVSASFIENNRRQPIQASGVSDEATARRHLGALAQKGILESHGSGPRLSYHLAGSK